MRKTLFQILKGAGMGMAEVVPGVSGGTIAFITGIYEELLASIRAFNLHQLKLVSKGEWKLVWKNIHGTFLLQLVIGMAMGLVIGILVLSHLIEEYPEILWAFFFGLILASAFYVFSLLHRKTVLNYLLIIFSAIVAYGITELSPSEGTENPVFLIASGMVAVSALLLPGLSGSFILLILGMYTIVLHHAKAALTQLDPYSFLNLVLFGLGCLLGLLVFSRFLGFLFKNFKDPTLAVLTGFMLGSLNKIWPWRKATLWVDESGKIQDNPLVVQEEWRVLQEVKLLPQNYAQDAYLFWAIIAFIIGAIVVLGLWRASYTKTTS